MRTNRLPQSVQTSAGFQGRSNYLARPKTSPVSLRAVTKQRSATAKPESSSADHVSIVDPSVSSPSSGRNSLFGSFNLPFTPLWALVAGWKQQSKEEEDGIASGPEILASTAVRASEVTRLVARDRDLDQRLKIQIRVFLHVTGLPEAKWCNGTAGQSSHVYALMWGPGKSARGHTACGTATGYQPVFAPCWHDGNPIRPSLIQVMPQSIVCVPYC